MKQLLTLLLFIIPMSVFTQAIGVFFEDNFRHVIYFHGVPSLDETLVASVHLSGDDGALSLRDNTSYNHLANFSFVDDFIFSDQLRVAIYDNYYNRDIVLYGRYLDEISDMAYVFVIKEMQQPDITEVWINGPLRNNDISPMVDATRVLVKEKLKEQLRNEHRRQHYRN